MVADLAHERQHGAKNFANWSDVVLRDPLREVDELRREDRLVVKDIQDWARFDRRRIVMKTEDDAGHLFIAEWHEDASANRRRGCTYGVGKRAVERNRQSNIAEGGHSKQGTG
jgi:hypothetical protein